MSVVAVAQLVESRIVIPVVVGSSPISHPKEFSGIKQLEVSELSPHTVAGFFSFCALTQST
jgi:hypothetical protein